MLSPETQMIIMNPSMRCRRLIHEITTPVKKHLYPWAIIDKQLLPRKGETPLSYNNSGIVHQTARIVDGRIILTNEAPHWAIPATPSSTSAESSDESGTPSPHMIWVNASSEVEAMQFVNNFSTNNQTNPDTILVIVNTGKQRGEVTKLVLDGTQDTHTEISHHFSSTAHLQ